MRFKDEARHAGVGFVLGLLGLLFGIAWVVYLTVNHENIHARLSHPHRAAVEEKAAPAALEGGHENGHGHVHADNGAGHGVGGEEAAAVGGAHTSPEMTVAHERLAKAHAHAMGLGILTIAVSLLLTVVPASARAKTLAAACVGTGGLFYPLSWIVMGMRTTSLGIEGAEASVVPMVGLPLVLVGFGLLLTLAFVARWLFRKA